MGGGTRGTGVQLPHKIQNVEALMFIALALPLEFIIP